MKKLTKFMKIIVLLIIGISALSINNAVKAEENVVLTLQLDPDTSKAETDGEIYLNVTITEASGFTLTTPIVINGVLNYDKNVFSSLDAEGANGWVATPNNENGKLLFDSNKIVVGKQIATIKLKLKKGIKAQNTKVTLSNIEASNGTELKPQVDNWKVTTTFSVPEIAGEEEPDVPDNTIKNEVTNDIANEVTNDISNGVVNEVKNTTHVVKRNVIADQIEKVNDITTSNKDIPQTGNGIGIFLLIGTLLLIGVISFIRDKKMYD